MFVQEEKIFAGKVLRLHICAADGSEWLEEATEDTSVEKLKESCLKHVRPSPLRPRCTSASFLPGNQKLRLLAWIPPLSPISTYSPDLRFCLGPDPGILCTAYASQPSHLWVGSGQLLQLLFGARRKPRRESGPADRRALFNFCYILM